MNEVMAKKYETRFLGKIIEGYTIGNLIDYGKSAAVFKAEDKDGIPAAFKIFDNEIIERFGKEQQTRRIVQEISLRNHGIENLVQIHGGGEFNDDGEIFLFIVMEFLQGQNLKKYLLQNKAQPEVFAKILFKTLYDVTERLLAKKIVHRDIKPENVLVATDGTIILMDLGVIKLIQETTGSETDIDGHKPFIGTLQYAPPEFLLREEDQENVEAWRAINVYQIAATVHDAVMGYEIFTQYTDPYARLVIAVKEEKPYIEHSDYSHEILSLIREMLVKNWNTRLQLLSKYNLEEVFKEKVKPNTPQMRELLKLSQGNRDKLDEIEVERKIAQRRINNENVIFDNIKRVMVEIAEEGLDSKLYKDVRYESGVNPHLRNQRVVICQLLGDLSHGFDAPMYIRAIVDQSHERTFIYLSALNPGRAPDKRDGFIAVFKDYPYKKGAEIINGVYNEATFKEIFAISFPQIFTKFYHNMKPSVDGLLDFQKQNAQSGKGGTHYSSQRKELFLDSFKL
jgi:serine/threonine protein kinase